ncbi:uncharacterized protein SOCE26_010400 [Sorangium cellulosum]|uniref:Magnesium chelatase n=1 Tax=Sorangium cellulosum TaxID=56 RepID=A0A2L0EK14_SORCE|nr:AAA family ATPase [Sorangium cellulosum]AUX39645.1 uncharacterized protein SOCE26_010400 [Sorangium cellulosum]
MRAPTRSNGFHILPYTSIVGQADLKLSLELSYVAPRIGGLLISGQRGTAKSTAVRAFSRMIHDGALPTTLPINATEDRVVGGWVIEALMRGAARRQPGLLEEADGKMLYIDEVNLLEDHLVNIILDVASTGVLVVEREGWPEQKPISFSLVGTMNPEEGSLRPQLQDRFGLMVTVAAERNHEDRCAILKTVLAFDGASDSDVARAGAAADARRRETLERAREIAREIRPSEVVLERCVALADAFKAEGHRGEKVLALAAGARAAIRAAEQGDTHAEVTEADVNRVARFALQHRRPGAWDEGRDNAILAKTTAELRQP